MAYYETIVTIQTEIKLRNEEDLELIAKKVYKDHVAPLLKSRTGASTETVEMELQSRIDNNISKHVNKAFDQFQKIELTDHGKNLPAEKNILDPKEQNYYQEIKENYKIIKDRMDKGAYTLGEFSPNNSLESITKKIVFDKFYKSEMSKTITALIKPYIEEILDRKYIKYPISGMDKDGSIVEKLSIHHGQDRHTFMMTGAPASGKSSLMGITLLESEKLGLDSSDFVTISMDSYRKLVSDPKELGSNTHLHSAFNADESLLIVQKTYDRLKEKITSGKGAPCNVIIDTVYPHQRKIDFALLEGGKLHITCATVPPEVALKRAFKRGEKTGRYVDTEYLLQSHRDISRDFHDIMLSNKGKDVDYTLIDNHVPLGELPILFERGNLKTGKIEIYNALSAKKFIDKGYVELESERNISANVAPEKEKIYTEKLQNAGMLIIRYPTEEKSSTISYNNINVIQKKKAKSNMMQI